MKRIITTLLIIVPIIAVAQESYINGELVTEDLNGTARYIGMGGAMEALGADVSVMSSNPAGVGLFRRSQVSLTGSIISQPGAGKYKYGDGTNASFDQGGVVLSIPMNSGRFFNIGFNYNKNRNFNNVTSVAGSLSSAAQNKNSYINLMDAYTSDPSGDWINSSTVSQLDAAYYNGFNGDADGGLYYNNGKSYTHDFATEGYVANYAINFSGNVSRRVYLGVTFLFSDINYRSFSTYSEELVDANNAGVGNITVDDSRRIDGTGFSLSGGIIFFPIEGSPFRIGASVATPTWYDMTSRSWTSLTNNTTVDVNAISPNNVEYGEYDYRLYTPWKFGVSLGHTIGNFLALGASYEYADYSSVSNRYVGSYDYYYRGSSVKDYNMNQHTQRTLKGVSTLKVGAEFKATKELAVRAGYNYVSALYRHDGYRDASIESLGTYYSSRADYTNWGATHRVTLGVGYSYEGFAIDVAWQYNTSRGTYYPFTSQETTYSFSDGTSEHVLNVVDGLRVRDKRHQFVATLSFRF